MNSVASGGDGADVIDASGASGAATIDGGAGDDRIVAAGSGSTVAGGDGADTIDAADAQGPTTLDGGAGDDVLRGGIAADAVLGGSGNDRLDGGPGANRLDGQDGDDILLSGEGDSGGEALTGGAGVDRVSYENADSGVRVTVGSGADDGRPGEADDVAGDVEQVDGTEEDDLLVAGPGGTTLVGQGGDDVLIGAGGVDVLVGGTGNDRLDGGDGRVQDTFDGGTGIDEITYARRVASLSIDMRSRNATGGESGEGDVYRDVIENIVGGKGADNIVGSVGTGHRIAAGTGDDKVRVVESGGQSSDTAADGVRCQGGDDVVYSDRLDTVSGDCERVLRDGNLARAIPVFSKRMSTTLSRSGRRLTVRLGCDRDVLGYCSTKVVVRRAGTTGTLARVERVRIKPGRWRRIDLTASSSKAASTMTRATRLLVVVVSRDKQGRGTLSKRLMRVKHLRDTSKRGAR